MAPSRGPYLLPWPLLGRLAFWLAVYFPLFYRLDALPLQQWDEARRAVNAAEMLERGSWLVPWFGDQPEMWGTKPPLLLWLQALCLQLLGYDELAIRLPSALAGLATIAMLVWFAERQLKKPLAGYLAGLALVTMPWCGFHVTRTGDFDALLTLWLTAALLFGWLWLESLRAAKPQPRWAWLAAGAIGLGGLTKGVAGFFFLPGMLLMVAIRGQLGQVWRRRELWLALPLAFGPLLAYYLAREWVNPGYLAAVWQNELGGRYGQPLEGHTGPWNFYLDQLARLDVWLWVLPVALFFGFRQNARGVLGNARDVACNVSTWILGTLLVFLTIISAAGTKLPWYVAPAWPPIALMLGIGLAAFAERLKEKWGVRGMVVAVLALALLYVGPFSRKLHEVAHPRHENPWEASQLDYGTFMEFMKDHRKYYLFQKGYNAALRFYEKAWNRRGYDVQRLYDLRPLQRGDLLMTCDDHALELLDKHGKRWTQIGHWRGCRMLRIE